MLWVALCCAVPLAALAAVLLFDAPALLASLVAFAALCLIAPHLLAASPRAQQGHTEADEQAPSNR